MRISIILGLLLFFGVSSIYGEETSCDELISATSSELKMNYDALKVYKKVKDITTNYRERKKSFGNNVTRLKNLVLSPIPEEFKPPEFGLGVALARVLIEDIQDQSSEIMLLCLGRIRRSRRGTSSYLIYY